jgi:hypothetical protein
LGRQNEMMQKCKHKGGGVSGEEEEEIVIN